MFLDQIGITGSLAGLLADGLARLGEVALRAVGREFGVRRGTGGGHLDSPSQRRSRTGLKVDNAKRPGTVVEDDMRH